MFWVMLQHASGRYELKGSTVTVPDRSHFFQPPGSVWSLNSYGEKAFQADQGFVYAFSAYVQEPMVIVEVECIPEDMEGACNRLSNDIRVASRREPPATQGM